MSKARNLSDFISDATIDSTEIADLSVTHAKLHTDMNLSSKTLTFAANQISGNSVDGGVISNFASTGIDDNASSTAVTILSDGKVGIGTASPSRKLTVLGVNNTTNFEVTDAAGGNTFNIYNNTTSSAVAIGTSSGLMSFGFNGIDKVHFKSDGKVGIGTSSPAVALEIIGTTTSGIRIKNNALHSNGFNIYVDSSTDTAVLNNPFSGPMLFETANTERMRIDNDGNVGIGGIAEPSSTAYNTATLHLRQVGSSSAGSQLRFTSGNSGHTNTDGGFISYWADNNFYFNNQETGDFRFFSGGLERMRINSSGNVGIGTSNSVSDPVSRLNVRAANNHTTGSDREDLVTFHQGISAWQVGRGAGIRWVGDVGRTMAGISSYVFGSEQTGLAFETGGATSTGNLNPTTRMVIDHNGNVGIGTESPTTKLEIHAGNNKALIGDLNSNSTMSLRMSDNAAQPVEVQAYSNLLKLRTTPSGGSITDAVVIDGDGYTSTINPRLTVGSGNYNARTGKTGVRVGRTVYNWFNYGVNGGHTYLHIKTNLANGGTNSQATMSSFHIRGYTYSAESIDSILGFHNWSGAYYNPVYTNNGSRAVVSSSWAPYTSTDGKVVIVLSIGNNYPGISIDFMQNFEYTWRDVEVSTYSKSPNASGVY
jgi:hypothetical protein